MVYGDKRDYPKIDIYVDGFYKGSTTWLKTCKEACERYIDKLYLNSGFKVKACFDKLKK